MELIKIEAPLADIMKEDAELLSEAQSDALLETVNSIVSSDDSQSLNSVVRESDIGIELAAYGGMAVLALITILVKWIRSKYRLSAQKLIDQSKELNDIYVKVDDLLKHDKMARFRHRNDKLDIQIKYPVMRDLKDPRKIYNLMVDYLAYDSEYFINEIDDIMKYVITQSSNKATDLENMKNTLMEKIDTSFKQNHGFVETCEPMMKVEEYKGVKLETAVEKYKTCIGNFYNSIYALNKYVDAELKYMQVMELAYKKMLGKYGNDKEAKKMVDEVFKKLLKNTSMSMDFNSKVITLCTEVVKFYAAEMEKVYNIIKN